MSRVNTMAQTIEELRDAAAAINSVADWLFQQFANTDDEAKAEEKLVITLEQVRAVLADKSRAGHTAAIRDLLQKYGASKLSQDDPKNYEALLRDAEVLDNAT
ncbi:MAG: DNA ligase [Lachnospiraceae bacterium]|nr:DNA ligase [Lachnospiraceae bacterium]